MQGLFQTQIINESHQVSIIKSDCHSLPDLKKGQAGPVAFSEGIVILQPHPVPEYQLQSRLNYQS